MNRKCIWDEWCWRMTIYEKEAAEFEKNFIRFKDKRIILYGTGRHTATLLPLLGGDWNIVGLMDRNQEYAGKQIFGLPVLSEEDAAGKADLIIINTSGTYWQIIYQRIEHLGLPVYYQNGCRAEKAVMEYEHIEYWDMTQERLLEKIDKYDVISFDFYDTLFQRKVYLPSEIFYMTAVQSVNKAERERYIQARKNACAGMGDENATLDMIYGEIQRQLHWTDEGTARVRAKETELEMDQLTVREDVAGVLRYAIAAQKEVYIISDMYLPKSFFEEVLSRNNIPLMNIQIWVSCEVKASKERGLLWKRFRAQIGCKSVLHIGDNWTDDVQSAKANGIEAVYCMSKNELMSHSSMRSILSLARSEYHMMILGLCENRLFGKAFDLGKYSGKIHFTDRKEFGYIVFGPVFFSFLFWIKRRVSEEGIKHLVLLGRDGYFLKEDFEYLEKLLGESKASVYYLETSRQILMCTCMESEADFLDYVRFPYRGCVCDYVEDRFGIALGGEDKLKYGGKLINAAQDYRMLIDLLQPYMEKVKETIRNSKEHYWQYLQGFIRPDQWGDGSVSVVDLGYYGTNQYYLSRIMKQNLKGYYMMADLSESNTNCRINEMEACACDPVIRTSENMHVYRKDLILESFLTSPAGMIKGMPDAGIFLYDTGKKNQEFFMDKVEINEGIKAFIHDMAENYSICLRDREDVYIDDFVDQWYGRCIENCTIDEAVKRSFYSDNAFVHRGQERVFEQTT